jgi:solute carrier family 25 folate transporter 32
VSAHVRRSYFAYAPLDSLVAGLTAGTLTTLWLHPFDLIKTRLQVGVPTTSGGGSAHRHGSIHAARVLLAHEGWRSLWKGLSPNLVGNAAAWGFYFCGFELVKQHLSEREPSAFVRCFSNPTHLPDVAHGSARPQRRLNALEFILAASFTGVCVSAMTNPIWVVKTRMFLDRTPMHSGAAAAASLPPHVAAKLPKTPVQPFGVSPPGSAPSSSLWSALRSLYAAEGFVGLYRGFVPSLFGVSHGALQFMAYEELKNWRSQQRRRQARSAGGSATTADAASAAPWTAVETISMSALSKAFASFCTYPYQTIRSQLQAAHGDARPTLRHVASVTWREHGIRGFYRGCVINLVRVLPAACSVFLVYEQVGGFFKKHPRYEHHEST